MRHDFDPAQIWGHMASIGAILGTLFGYLPYIAAVVAVIWYLLQIWESQTVQKWWHPNMTPLERERKLALLVAAAKVLNAEIVAQTLTAEAGVTADELRVTAAEVAKTLKNTAENLTAPQLQPIRKP